VVLEPAYSGRDALRAFWSLFSLCVYAGEVIGFPFSTDRCTMILHPRILASLRPVAPGMRHSDCDLPSGAL
jgi:hypothetical protein